MTSAPSNAQTGEFADASLDGRYHVTELIGRGGMASVYRATDTRLGRTVAVKIFSETAGGIEDGARRRSEIALLASLSHPALVTLHDAGRDERTGREFIVMELIEGSDLRDVLATGSMNEADAAALLADVAEALHVIHGQGIVHRDVKPANVLLTPSHLPSRRWHAKLADFGIARLIDDTRLTAAGQIIGTPGYLSPEQVLGREVGSAADVYALGLLLIEARTGAAPFPGPAIEAASARLARDPDVPAEFGDDWTDLLRAMTAREPTDRPAALDVAIAARALDAPGVAALLGDSTPAATRSEPGTTQLFAPMQNNEIGPFDPTAVLPVAFDDRPSVGAPPSSPVSDAAPASAPGYATSARPTDAPSGDVTRRPRIAALVIIAVVAIAVAALVLPALFGGIAASNPEPTPVPSLPGELGVHLEQLEEAVTP